MTVRTEHFCGLKDICHFSDHWTTVSKSCWKVRQSVSVFICLGRMQSSANNFTPGPSHLYIARTEGGPELCLVKLQMPCGLRLMYHHQPLQTAYVLFASCLSTVWYFLSRRSSSTYGVVSGVLHCQTLLKNPALGNLFVVYGLELYSVLPLYLSAVTHNYSFFCCCQY